MYCLSNVFLNLKVHVFVFRDALVYWEGGTFAVIPLEEIEAVHESEGGLHVEGVPVVKNRGLLICDRQGRAFTFTHALDRIEELAKLIQQDLVRRKLPQARALINAGKPVEFGPVTVDASALYVKGRRLDWPEINSIEIGGGSLCIAKKKGFTEVPLFEVPNAQVLLPLAEEIRKKVSNQPDT
jgi:hypothetical protein